MSPSLFVVRVRTSHRLYESSWRLSSASEKSRMIRIEKEFEKIFTERKLADDYVTSNFPVDLNPFGHSGEISVHDGIFCRNYFEPEWVSNYRSLFNRIGDSVSDLCVSIRKAGYEPPEKAQSCSRQDWKVWWESTTQLLSFSEKEELKSEIGIRTISTNPFDCLYLYFIEGQDNEVWLEFSDFYQLLVDELVEVVEGFGLSIRSVFAEKDVVLGLFVWWEENKNKMTTLQRAQVWKLVDPFPYEIVEVPLETAR